MGVLEKNRPQATSKSNSVAVQKAQSNSPEKPKTNERSQEKTSAPKKPDEGSKKGKMTASAASKPSVTKVCACCLYHIYMTCHFESGRKNHRSEQSHRL